MASTPSQVLKQTFGFDQFREGQQQVVDTLLSGRSAAAVFPTGGGKSLCYQLPALMLPGITLVVSPLIALMKDQIDSLVAKGVQAARLDSSVSSDEYRDIMSRLRNGQLKLLYVAPERFTNERFRAMLSGQNISLFAIDEAHCISEWGHNFRPDYLKLAEFSRQFSADAVLALTATATPAVLKDMCRFLNIDSTAVVQTQFYRSNLTLLADSVNESTRDTTLLSHLQTRSAGSTIVYVTLQKTAEKIAGFLQQQGLSARAYHAGLADELRSEIQEWFMQSDDSIVVATIAFGMGIDKSDIRYVYHYNLPKSLENYAQEIGRAGRDGNPSSCDILYCPDDLSTLENFIYGDTPELSAIESLIDALFTSDEMLEVSLYSLSREHDIRPLVLRTLLTYLQLDGYLEEATPVYSQYKFAPKISSKAIVAKFDAARGEYLRKLFRQAKQAKKWFTIDLAEVAKTLAEPREKIVKTFDYLAEHDLLELQPSGLVHRYKRVKQPASLSELAAALHQRMLHRERRDLDRLQEVVTLVTEPGCQVNRLSAHFGEHREHNCGHCSHCLGQQKTHVSQRSTVTIDQQTWQKALSLRADNPVLQSPVQFTRFVCGITSPALSRAKLTGNPLFGSLATIPFDTIRQQAEQA